MIRVSFLSGTRADYSKIKPYIEYLTARNESIRIFIFMTGMHLLGKYGKTWHEAEKDFGKTCTIIRDSGFRETTTARETAHIISAYDRHLNRDKIDFVFVHGDRPEALAGAIAARLNNIPLCQIEAGDISGSIDDSIRHAITKLAHRFLVSDKAAKSVLLRLGETRQNIFIAGNSSLANVIPPINPTDHKRIPFSDYAILIYHPVTTLSAAAVRKEIQGLMKILDHSGLNYLVILPNNDLNHQVILDTYRLYRHNPHFCFCKSLPLEFFVNLLKKAHFLIGNSSCGIKEAPYYQVPCIDIGCRQHNRYWNLTLPHFHHLDTLDGLEALIRQIVRNRGRRRTPAFRRLFLTRLNRIFTPDFWIPPIQKEFHISAISKRKQKP